MGGGSVSDNPAFYRNVPWPAGLALTGPEPGRKLMPVVTGAFTTSNGHRIRATGAGLIALALGASFGNYDHDRNRREVDSRLRAVVVRTRRTGVAFVRVAVEIRTDQGPGGSAGDPRRTQGLCLPRSGRHQAAQRPHGEPAGPGRHLYTRAAGHGVDGVLRL